jgi:sugar phosphate isomerase/epimerase
VDIGIFAKTFSGSDPGTVLKAVAAAGFGAAQYNMACSGLAAMPDSISSKDAEAVGGAAREAGVTIAGVSGTYNMIHPDPAIRATGLRRLDVIAAACARMSTNLITLCTGTRDAQDQWRHHPDSGTPEAWRDLLEEIAGAIDIAERHGVYLGIEPELANVVDSAQAAKRLIMDCASDRLKIVLDPANLFERASLAEQRRLISEAAGLLGEHIAMAHAKDRTSDGGFTAAGKGVVDFQHFVGCLKQAGFDGPLIAHGLDQTEAPGVAAFLKGLT